MSNLGPQHINLSFGGLLQLPNGASGSLATVQDGAGNATALEVSITAVDFPIESPTGGASGMISDLATDAGSSFVGFEQAGAGAVTRSVQDKARETVSVLDFGADPTGVADSTQAIQRAAAAIQSLGGGELLFPPGTYTVFSSTTGTLCSFSGLVGIACLGYGATLKVPSSKVITASEGYFFYFDNCKNITVDGFTTDGPVLDVSSTTVKGYEFVRCINGCRNINMPVNRVKNSLAGFICSKAAGDANSMRTQDIHIGVLDVVNCWYGINGQYSGDFMRVDCLRTDTVHRSFFVYGASNIKANILSKDHKAVDVPVSTLSGLVVSDIEINYYSGEESINCGSAPKVKIGFGNETASTLRNFKINLNVAYNASGNTGGAALFIEKVNNSGNPDPSDRGHILDNLIVTGTITGTASYNSGGSIVTDPLATWGTGDYFRNIALENLRITGANAQSQVVLTFGNVQDQILVKNFYSAYALNIRNAATGQTRVPNIAKLLLENVQCINRYAYDGTSGAQPLDLLRPFSAPDTVQTGWSGRLISITGLGGAAVWNLPAAAVGLEYTFVRTDSQVMDIVPSGTEIIRGGTAGQRVRMNTAGNLIHLACFQSGYWEVLNYQGAYTFV